MPMVRNGTTDLNLSAKLAERLAFEIRTPGQTGQPTIYENRIGHTQRYAVTVIWDAWSKLTQQARSRIILDAYESALPDRNGKISIAMGLTTADASSLGVLPFAVTAIFTQADAPLRERILQAMVKQGVTADANNPELRFRTLEEAEAAFARLQEEVPGPFWLITQAPQPIS